MKHTNRNTLIMALAVLMIAAMHSCSDGHDEPLPPEPEPPRTEEAASRTILVYMVATNSLGSGGFDSSDLSEMMRAAAAGDFGEGKLIAYHASSSGVVLIDIHAEKVDTVKQYESGQQSVTIERMRQVIDDTKEYAPAESYGLVLWSHSTGWLQDGIDDDSSPLRSFGIDGFVNSKTMNITSLATALNGADIDFIYFDCCYMGSVETLYELRNCAKYMIASPAEIPSPGMPYDSTLKYLFDISTSLEENAVNAATSTFETYDATFVKGDCPNTMAVVKTSELENLASLTRQIYQRATMLSDPDITYQRYKTRYPCYYYDFGQYVESICNDEQLLVKWRLALENTVLYAKASPWVWSSIEILHYSGLSTYILSSQDNINDKNYSTLSWYTDVASALFNK